MEISNIDFNGDLIVRCANGDKRAQLEIYKRYYRAMYNSSLRIVGQPEEAEDIMQESFLTAFKKLETITLTVSFGAWLKKIVVNRSLDVLRRRRVLFEPLDDELPFIDEPELPSDMITVETVKRAINSLPDGYRTILSLVLLEGYDHEEVSEILGIKNVTSRTQFSRARRRLQEILVEDNKHSNFVKDYE